jgi:hypothetical protein
MSEQSKRVSLASLCRGLRPVATGYRIYYDSSGGHSGFEDVTNGSFDNYTLKVSPPGEILLAVISATPTSISLSWSIASRSATDWEVVWRDSNGNVTENTSGSLSGTNYTDNDSLTTTLYSVRVRAVNAIGTTESPHIIIVTSNFSNVNVTSLPPTSVCDSCPQTNTSSTSCSGIDDNVTSIATGACSGGGVIVTACTVSIC